MKKNFLIAISILIIIVLACGRGKKDEEKEEITEKSKKEKIEDKYEDEEEEIKEKIVYGNPIILENSDLVLIPLTLTETDEDFFGRIKKEYFDNNQSLSPYSQNFSSFNLNDLHNVIFYNKVTEEEYPLIEKRELINNIYIPQNPSKDTVKTNFIIFSTISDDYNKDGKIDKADGETVFICDIDGKNKKQISDNNITLLKWEFDLKYDILFLVLKEDTDDDKKFTNADEINIFRTSLSNPSMPVEVIRDSLKNDLKNIYK
ncbi:hypothetical protein ACFLSV_02500 [Bacteroidota bacterium]